MGFPTKPTHHEWNISYEKAKDLAGWWEITTSDSLPFQEDLNGVWTTPDIRFFHDQGVNFKIKFGCWDDNPLPTIDMPEQKEVYCIFSGLLTREKNIIRQHWIDDSQLIESPTNQKGVKLQDFERSHWRSGFNLSSYVYSYARTQIWKQAIINDAVAITVDCIITERPIEIPGIAHDGKALWTTEQFTKPYDADVASEYDTLLLIPFLERTKMDKSRMRKLRKLMPPKPGNYVAPSLNYCSKYSRDKYPVTYPKRIRPRLEHGIPDRPVVLMKGPGGTGKTYCGYQHWAWYAAVYVAPTHKLLEDKRNEGWFQAITHLSFPNETHGHRAAWLLNDIPKYVFIDEIGMMNRGDLKRCLDACKKYSIRVIMAGDEAQICRDVAVWDLATEVSDVTLQFKIDRRSKDHKIRTMKARVRDIVMSDKDLVGKIWEIRSYLALHARRAYKPHRNKLPHLKLYNHDPDKHGPLPEGGCRCVDSVQGTTIHEPTVCVINGNTRRDQLPELIYTMVSRFVSNEDLYIFDTTGFSKTDRKP